MNIDSGFVFSLLSALLTLGGLCVGFGVLKSKVDQSVEENKRQAKALEHCATKDELVAIKNPRRRAAGN